jgi:NTP pyrophosphatase (non-canonical NTP hydrolase)
MAISDFLKGLKRYSLETGETESLGQSYVRMSEDKKGDYVRVADLLERADFIDLKGLDRLAKKMYKIAEEHGFHENEVVGSKAATPERMAKFIANLHGECSELWEAVRKRILFDPCDKLSSISNAEEELADIVIRAMDTAHSIGISLGFAVEQKSSYNQLRPYKHGKSC